MAQLQDPAEIVQHAFINAPELYTLMLEASRKGDVDGAVKLCRESDEYTIAAALMIACKETTQHECS